MRNENLFTSLNISSYIDQDFNIEHHNGFALETIKPTPEILFITSYPPRECGIATYSQDLIKSLNNKFGFSFKINVCPLDSNNEKHSYPSDIKYKLNTDCSDDFIKLAATINRNDAIKIVMIQHEFGLFKQENYFKLFLKLITKPVVLSFHTVLPNPNDSLKNLIQVIDNWCESLIVMTNNSAKILSEDYGISQEKITVIQHGTHLVSHTEKAFLKEKYNVANKKILTTFGLLSSGKNIETTLKALPSIVKKNPKVLFLIIGITHPSVLRQEGEKYREMLEEKVKTLHLRRHVKFINSYVDLEELLEYLQMTDIYLFTSKDPNQAVSGTFSYAMSCGCPIISTPIPHSKEVLQSGTGIIFDFENAEQLANGVNKLLIDTVLRKKISANSLHYIAPTAWENTAIAHARLFVKISNKQIVLNYKTPAINIDHFRRLCTDFGMIQFSVINQPDIGSGYTLDDNARAMVALCQHYDLNKEKTDLALIDTYLNFIKYCLQPEGYFLNYVDQNRVFTEQNNGVNLADSNGRAIWALGFLTSKADILPSEMVAKAESIIKDALPVIKKIYSTRAMAFIIKGLYYRNTQNKSLENVQYIKEFANRIVQMYLHESDDDWEWFESYLTYGNSSLPEAMLCAYLATGLPAYREIAKKSFDFLLSKIFTENKIKVISNKGWSHKGENYADYVVGGEQPIDVAYTILALDKFYEIFKDETYKQKIEIAFSWFLGNNHLHQIIYNPCTGGCYDGLEENYINLNQGAESTISYFLARLTIEKLTTRETILNPEKVHHLTSGPNIQFA
jgi:glycosyltransferase involved in cell wall biosynthesis